MSSVYMYTPEYFWKCILPARVGSGANRSCHLAVVQCVLQQTKTKSTEGTAQPKLQGKQYNNLFLRVRLIKISPSYLTHTHTHTQYKHISRVFCLPMYDTV